MSNFAKTNKTPENVYRSTIELVYDVSVLGGAVGDISLKGFLPVNAKVIYGYVEILTPFASAGGTGTIALKALAAGDLLAAVDADTLAGVAALKPTMAASTIVKNTGSTEAEIKVTVGSEALTAGKAKFVLTIDK